MSSALDRKQIDDKIRQIEKCFHGREVNRASGSADLHTWELEEWVATVLGWLCLSVLLKTVKKPPLPQNNVLSCCHHAGGRPMIQPDTISSLAADDKVPETSSAPSSQPSSVQDAVVPSTSGSQGKKLSCKTNQSDHVLAYLKASVSTCCLDVQLSVSSLDCLILMSEAHEITLQDKAAADAQKQNNMYKRQLIGLLAKVCRTSTYCDCDLFWDCAAPVKNGQSFQVVLCSHSDGGCQCRRSWCNGQRKLKWYSALNR